MSLLFKIHAATPPRFRVTNENMPNDNVDKGRGMVIITKYTK